MMTAQTNVLYLCGPDCIGLDSVTYLIRYGEAP
jgi:hypothetical protein